MDRSLIQKAKELAKGTRRIPLFTDDDQDVIDAEFVDVPAIAEVVEVAPQPIEPLSLAVAELPRVTPGRARRATDAYAPVDGARRPIISIG